MSHEAPIEVGEVMSSPLRTVSPDATVREAARAMREHDVSALVVPIGPPAIVTSTDVLDVVAAGRDPETVRVREVMTTEVETVPPDIRLAEAAAMMTSLGVKHLPVVDDDDFVGMVSSTDITEHLS